jgi:hypothetical protein
MLTTAYTDRTIAYAAQAGLRPEESGTYRGAVAVNLNGSGEHATFGTIVVGTKTGAVLRATLTYGNHGSTQKFEGARAVRRAIKALVVERACSKCEGPVAVPVYDDGEMAWRPGHEDDWAVYCTTSCLEDASEAYWTAEAVSA